VRLVRFPPSAVNPDARELERLTATLGIDTATRLREGRSRPTAAQVSEHATLKADRSWMIRQLERAERTIEPPPVRTRQWLAERRDDLDALRRHLLRSRPRWERDLGDTYPPVPNLIGHIDLQKLLITDAFVRIHEGDTATALADVEAVWNLASALRDEPFVIEQLIAVTDVHAAAAALRQIEDVPGSWLERLSEHDYRASLLSALAYEAWKWTQDDDPVHLADHPVVPAAIVAITRKITGPYGRYCAADVSNDYRERLVNLERLPAICDYDLSADRADLDVPIPFWNRIAPTLVPDNLAAVVDRLARLQVDLELTAKLIELGRARRTNAGTWPASLAGIERSEACPRDRWVYRVAADGTMTLALDRQLEWRHLVPYVGPRYPTRFRVAP
jgi:hypothetical protein